MVVSIKSTAGKKPPKAKGKKAFADAETAVSNDSEKNVKVKAEKVEIPIEVVSPNGIALDAEIEFGLQTIIPTGEFQNIRVVVSCKCRCEADTDVMDSTFEVIKDWVDNKISSVTEEIIGG